MDPITLHFNIFQAGAPVRTSLQVEDPRATTILALKQQMFSDEIKASKSVRFIAAGKILEDTAALERYKLGKEAHIHVSISDGARPQPTSAPEGNASTTTAEEAKPSSGTSSPNESRSSMLGWAILAGVIIFAGTGIALWIAFQKRRQYTMHTSQLLFICAAIWVYLLFFHALPSLFQALNKRNSSVQDTPTRSVTTSSVTAGAIAGSEAAGAASSSAASPASPGLSLMTPPLPPGDATAASVLTQRR
jgi:hypothetical protein